MQTRFRIWGMPGTRLRRALWCALIGAPIAFAAMWFVVPIMLEAGKSVHFPLVSFQEYGQFASESVGTAVKTSLSLALASSLLAACLGVVLLAALASSWPRVLKGMILVGLVLPFAASELVRIVSWLLLLAPSGPVASLLDAIGVGSPDLAANRTAVLIGLVHVELPFFTLAAWPVVSGIGRIYSQAASSLGASRLQVILTVILPLALPGLVAAWALAFVLGLAYYATPALLGGLAEQSTLPSLIMSNMFTTANWSQAAAVGMLLLALGVIGFGLLAALGGLRVMYAGALGRRSRTHRRRVVDLQTFACSQYVGRFAEVFEIRAVRAVLRGIHTLAVIGIVAYLVAPTVAALPASLGSSPLVELFPKSFSFRWYEFLFRDPAWSSALWTSLSASVCAAAIATILGLCAAIALVRSGIPFKSAYFAFLLLPMVMPLPVTALGLFFVMNMFHLSYTWFSLVLAYSLFGLPYTTIVLASALQAFDWELDHAAESLGARPLKRLRTILFPLLKPAIVVAGFFAFLTAFTELIFGLFMRTQTLTTLQVQMWSQLSYNLDPTAAAVAGVQFAIVLGGIVIWFVTSRLFRLRHSIVGALKNDAGGPSVSTTVRG